MKGPQLVVFASGTKDAGGSGFENLVKSPELDAEIVAVVSNHEHGGVRARALKLGVPFIFFPGPYTAEEYHRILQKALPTTGRIWVALSGWLKKAEGLDPASTFNIHPALLSFQNRRFGGAGLYGHHVHEAVIEHGCKVSGCTVHFLDNSYDTGPIVLQQTCPVLDDDTADTLAARVFEQEKLAYPEAIRLFAQGRLKIEGRRVRVLGPEKR